MLGCCYSNLALIILLSALLAVRSTEIGILAGFLLDRVDSAASGIAVFTCVSNELFLVDQQVRSTGTPLDTDLVR